MCFQQCTYRSDTMNTIMSLCTDCQYRFEWSWATSQDVYKQCFISCASAQYQIRIMLKLIPNDLSVASVTSLSEKEPIKDDEILMLEEIDADDLSSFSPSPPASPCLSEDDNCQYCLQCGREFVEKGDQRKIFSRSYYDPQLCNGCRK